MLKEVLQTAVARCRENLVEETGGLIFQRGDEFFFRYFENLCAGEERAKALYLINPQDLGPVLGPLFKDGWKFFASFHTHPTFSASPSYLDLTALFQGFKVNFIHSIQENKTVGYEWDDIKKLKVKEYHV